MMGWTDIDVDGRRSMATHRTPEEGYQHRDLRNALSQAATCDGREICAQKFTWHGVLLSVLRTLPVRRSSRKCKNDETIFAFSMNGQTRKCLPLEKACKTFQNSAFSGENQIDGNLANIKAECHGTLASQSLIKKAQTLKWRENSRPKTIYRHTCKKGKHNIWRSTDITDY